MNILTWIRNILLAVIILLVGIVFYITVVLDPNDYKAPISEKISETLPVNLELGELSWNFFPWLGIQVTASKLKNLNAEPLASIEQIQVKTAILPLLSGNILVENLLLEKPTVYYQVKFDQSTNWSEVLAALGSSNSTTPQATDTSHQNTQLPALLVKRFNLKQAKLIYTDENTQQNIAVKGLNLKAENFSLDQAFPISLDFLIEAGGLSVDVDIHSKLDFKLDTLVLEPSRIKIANTQLDLTGEVLKLSDPSYTINLQSNTIDLAKLLSAFDIKPPMSASLELVFEVQASGTMQALEINFSKLRFDQTRGHMVANISPLSATPSISLSGEFDQVDLDHYSSLFTPESTTAENQSTTPINTTQPSSTSSTTPPTPIPVDLIRQLALDIQLKLGHLIVNKIPSTEVDFKLTARDGMVTLNPLKAKSLNGNIQIQSTLDARSTPKLSLNKQVSQLDLGELARVYQPNAFFEGLLSLKAELTAQGDTTDALFKDLTGDASMTLANGLLKGQNLSRIVYDQVDRIPLLSNLLDNTQSSKINQLKQRLDKDSKFNNVSSNMRFSPGQIEFTQIQGKVDETGRIQGTGTINTLTNQMAFHLNLTLNKTISNAYLAQINWPVNCQGSLKQAPTCAVDSSAVTSQVGRLVEKKAKQEAKQKIKKKTKAKEKELKNKLEEKLNERLKDGLRGLFR